MRRSAAVITFVLAALAQGWVMAGAQSPAAGCPARDGWAALVHTYLTGDADALVARLATCGVRDVARLRTPQVEHDDEHTREAIAVLATEASFHARQSMASFAFDDIAADLMFHDVCSTEPVLPPQRIMLCSRWYQLVVASKSRPWIEGTRDFLPGHAEIPLAAGAHEEFRMGPRIEGDGRDGRFLVEQLDGPFITTSHGQFGAPSADLAVDRFRKAIALEPNLAEAHLRLGHVLWLLDRKDAAIASLTAALTAAKAVPDQFSEYLAHLLLAQIAEAQRSLSEATDHYVRAEAIGPRFSSAVIGHARLLTDAGDADAARAVLHAYFTRVAGQPSVIDPWAVYPLGRAFHYRFEELKALRAELRR